MTRSIEPFAPADGHTVRMYTCGPTVYNPAHLGNFRTFLFEDLLRRTLRLRGWGVEQVMNLTDVDDKIIAKAHRDGVTITAITDPGDHRLPRGPPVSQDRGCRALPAGDGVHPADDPAGRAAHGAGAGVPGGRRVGVFRDRAVSAVRAVVAAGHAGGEGWRAGGAGRLLEGERAGFRVMEGGEAGGRAGGGGVGFALGAWPAGVASGVLGDGDRVAGGHPRSPLWRGGSDFPASRGRDRAVGGRDGGDVFAPVVPWRVPADGRRQDGEAGGERDGGGGPSGGADLGGGAPASRCIRPITGRS